jgi:hypothetical protein
MKKIHDSYIRLYNYIEHEVFNNRKSYGFRADIMLFKVSLFVCVLFPPIHSHIRLAQLVRRRASVRLKMRQIRGREVRHARLVMHVQVLRVGAVDQQGPRVGHILRRYRLNNRETFRTDDFQQFSSEIQNNVADNSQSRLLLFLTESNNRLQTALTLVLDSVTMDSSESWRYLIERLQTVATVRAIHHVCGHVGQRRRVKIDLEMRGDSFSAIHVECRVDLLKQVQYRGETFANALAVAL